MSTFSALPPHCDPYEFKHTCLVKCQPNEHIDAVATDEEGPESSSETRKCVSVPYVTSNHFHSYDVGKMFAEIIKEVVSFRILVHTILIIKYFLFLKMERYSFAA